MIAPVCILAYQTACMTRRSLASRLSCNPACVLTRIVIPRSVFQAVGSAKQKRIAHVENRSGCVWLGPHQCSCQSTLNSAIHTLITLPELVEGTPFWGTQSLRLHTSGRCHNNLARLIYASEPVEVDPKHELCIAACPPCGLVKLHEY